MYLVSALGGLLSTDGGDMDVDDEIKTQPLLLVTDAELIGHKNARCSSQPTSDIMLAFRKYGVTSRRNFTKREITSEQI